MPGPRPCRLSAVDCRPERRRAPRYKGWMQDFVVITGLSGAGKSQAMACFEDAGYFCVDNLPPEMIGQLAELFEHQGSKVERAAVVSDVRGGDYFDGLVRVLDELEGRGVAHRLLYLEASDDVLVNRFKETRRRHPLASGGGSPGRSPRSASCSSRCASALTSRSRPPTSAPRGCARWWRTRCCRGEASASSPSRF